MTGQAWKNFNAVGAPSGLGVGRHWEVIFESTRQSLTTPLCPKDSTQRELWVVMMTVMVVVIGMVLVVAAIGKEVGAVVVVRLEPKTLSAARGGGGARATRGRF